MIMAEASAQCGLLPFPGEIRNKIYHLLFDSKKYLILWPVASPTDSTPPGTTADLALLQVSKTTREEATSVLYAECQFRCLMDFAVEVHSPLPPLQAFTLMNDITLDFRSGPGKETAQTCGAVLEMLAETNVPCEKLRIMLHVQTFGAWSPSRRQTEVFLGVLEGLEDFRNVNVEIIHVGKSQDMVNVIKKMVRDSAKIYLGKPIEREWKVAHDLGWAFNFEFHPRECHSFYGHESGKARS